MSAVDWTTYVQQFTPIMAMVLMMFVMISLIKELKEAL